MICFVHTQSLFKEISIILTSLIRIWLTRSFKPFIFENKFSNSLDFEELDTLGLYVHIPFCRNLCDFCPYCKIKYDNDIAKRYLKALLKEIKLVGSSINNPKQVTSLYFGGGSPALMAEDIKTVINKIEEYFIISNGVGIELHPSDINEKNLKLLKDAGVTMVSIGIQSFDSGCIDMLGRRSEFDYKKLFDMVREVNFDVVDVDLIFGIPTQTEEKIIKDIEIAFKNGATQISTYPFIDFSYAKNREKPLSEKQKKKILQKIVSYCSENGYERTSVWTFAKKETEKYSSITRDNFIGFGVSATTLLKKQFKINTFSIDGYIERIDKNSLPTALTLDFTFRQRVAYYIFWATYSMKIDKNRFEKFFNMPFDKIFWFEKIICILFGFVKQAGNEYHITSKGAYYYHYIEQVYTTSYIDKMWNISQKKPFPENIVLK